MPKIAAEIQFVEDGGKWYIVLRFAGHDIERWGPYADELNCFAMREEAAKRVWEIRRQQHAGRAA